MPALDFDECADALMKIFDDVTTLTPTEVMHAIPHTRGKVYELYCVARLLAELSGKGVTASFSSPGPLVFRKSGGHADPTFPHFDLFDPTGVFGRLYTDIEVRTLGATIGPVADLSAFAALQQDPHQCSDASHLTDRTGVLEDHIGKRCV